MCLRNARGLAWDDWNVKFEGETRMLLADYRPTTASGSSGTMSWIVWDEGGRNNKGRERQLDQMPNDCVDVAEEMEKRNVFEILVVVSRAQALVVRRQQAGSYRKRLLRIVKRLRCLEGSD
jgi:hypothetical protein